MSESPRELSYPQTPEPIKRKGGRPPKSAKKAKQIRNPIGKNQHANNLHLTQAEIDASGLPETELDYLKEKGRLILKSEEQAEVKSMCSMLERDSVTLSSHPPSEVINLSPLLPVKRGRGRPRKQKQEPLPPDLIPEPTKRILRDFHYKNLWLMRPLNFEELDEHLAGCNSLDIWQEHITRKRNAEKQLEGATKRKRLKRRRMESRKKRELEKEAEDMLEDRENYATLVENDVEVIEVPHTRLEYLSTLKGSYETVTEECTIFQPLYTDTSSEESLDYGYDGKFKDIGYADEEAEEEGGEEEEESEEGDLMGESSNTIPIKATKTPKQRPKKARKPLICKINFNTPAPKQLEQQPDMEISPEEPAKSKIPIELLEEAMAIIKKHDNDTVHELPDKVELSTKAMLVASRLAHIIHEQGHDSCAAIDSLKSRFDITPGVLEENSYVNCSVSLSKIMKVIRQLQSGILKWISMRDNDDPKIADFEKKYLFVACGMQAKISALDPMYFGKSLDFVTGWLEKFCELIGITQDEIPDYINLQVEEEASVVNEAQLHDNLKKELCISWEDVENGNKGSLNKDFVPNKHYKNFSIVIRGAKMNTIQLLNHIHTVCIPFEFMYGVQELGYDGTPHYHILVSFEKCTTWSKLTTELRREMDNIKYLLTERGVWDSESSGSSSFMRFFIDFQADFIPIKSNFEIIVYPVVSIVKQMRYLSKSIEGGLDTLIETRLNPLVRGVDEGDSISRTSCNMHLTYGSFFKSKEALDSLLNLLAKDKLRGRVNEEGKLRYDSVTNNMIDEILEGLPEATKALGKNEETLHIYYNEALKLLGSLKVKGASRNAMYTRFLIYAACKGNDPSWFLSKPDINSDLYNYISSKISILQPHLERFTPIPDKPKPDIGDILDRMNSRIEQAKAKAKGTEYAYQIVKNLEEERQRGYDLATWLIQLLDTVTGQSPVYKQRHLYVYGMGNNGKTSLLEFLKKHFHCYSLKFTKDFALATSAISKPYEVIIVEEFDISVPLNRGANLSLQNLNELLGKEADAARFEKAKKCMDDWITIGTKGSFYSMFPYPTYVFLGNGPLPVPASDNSMVDFKSQRIANLYEADAIPYIAFYERFFGIINITERESHIPREFLDLVEKKPRAVERVGTGRTNKQAQLQYLRERTGRDLSMPRIPTVLRDRNKENTPAPILKFDQVISLGTKIPQQKPGIGLGVNVNWSLVYGDDGKPIGKLYRNGDFEPYLEETINTS